MLLIKPTNLVTKVGKQSVYTAVSRMIVLQRCKSIRHNVER